MKLFRHRHTLETLDVQYRAGLLTTPGSTLVLYRCTRCGEHEVESITGRWPAGLFIPGAPDVRPEVVSVPSLGADRG